jgi:hypothetical protein
VECFGGEQMVGILGNHFSQENGCSVRIARSKAGHSLEQIRFGLVALGEVVLKKQQIGQ